MSLEGLTCCACREYHGLNERYFDCKKDMLHILEDLEYEFVAEQRDDSACHILLTQMWSKKKPRTTNLDRFIRFVDENKLGKITVAPAHRNPNTGNWVKPAIFTLHGGNCDKFWRAHKGVQLKENDESWQIGSYFSLGF